MSELGIPSAQPPSKTTGGTVASAIAPAAQAQGSPSTGQGATTATVIAPAARAQASPSTAQVGTAASAIAPAAQAQGGSSTPQGATNAAAPESSAPEYTYVAPVEDGINLGPQGSSISPEQADANQEARLAAWNQASAATAAARNLTISDYLAPGDSLSNYAAGTTITQLIQGYSCTVPNMADPKAGEFATTGRVMVHGAAITGLVPDPYGGPAAPLGSIAAAMFQVEGCNQKGGLPPSLQA